jgi:hypothetical protein
MTSRPLLPMILGFGLLCSPAANAQSDRGAMTSVEAETAFIEAFNARQHTRVIEVYDDILSSGNFPQLRKKKTIVMRYCRSLLSVKPPKLSRALDALEKLLQNDPENVSALFLLAQIKTSTGRPEDLEEAKEYLRSAARLGHPVLIEFQNPSYAKQFSKLLNQPQFMLRLMKAVQDFDIGDRVFNIFRSPTEELDEAAPDPNEEIKNNEPEPDRKKLEDAIDKLFVDIEDLLERDKEDKLLQKFIQISELRSRYRALGSRVVRQKLEEWNKKEREYTDVRMMLRLTAFIDRGNTFLREMNKQLQREQFGAVVQLFQQLSALVDRMRAERNEDYVRNAEALFYKGQKIHNQAIKLSRIRQLRLSITGIIIDELTPTGADRVSGNRAIVNDRIYKEGDLITNNQGAAIKELVLIEILEGVVRFRYMDTSFTRQLKAPLTEGQDTASPAVKKG